MLNNKFSKSISLVMILILSSLAGMIMLPNTSAAGINQTTYGNLNGQETWSGTHTLTDNVTIVAGASLVVSAGSTINIPFGKHIDVQGAICVASKACGAPSDGSSSTMTKFSWSSPTDYTVRGSCIVSIDAACGSGIVIRNTIDESKTGLNFVEFDNTYGYEIGVSALGGVTAKYGALVFDGPNTNANGLTFIDVNSTNILLVNLANPTITDSTFNLGADDYSIGKSAAITAYGAGSGIANPFVVSKATLTGDSEGTCGTSGSGISMIYVENSYVSLDDITITDNGYGAFFQQSSGELKNSEFTVNCAAVDTKGLKQTGDIKHTLTINNNIFTTTDGAGIFAGDQSKISATGNVITGVAKSSGVAVKSSIATLVNNQIGPIGGFNGLWIYGTSDVVAIGNTITDTAKEAVVHGEYHYRDSGWPSIQPTQSRLYMENNSISNNVGTCNSKTMYGGDFQCPAIHIFRSSATLYNNTVSDNLGDALRIKGGIVNVQGNTMSTGSFAVNISHHNDQANGNKFGSIGYFSGNTYTNATQVYNITESRVTIQSEYIPDAGGDELYPIQLRWLGSECPDVQNQCLQVPDTSEMPPAEMPMSLQLVNNSTVLSYSALQNFDTSKIHVQNQNSPWGTQVREGELVRFQIKAMNSDVAGANVIIKNSTGFPLYTLTTDQFGFTPQVTLPSDFYLDRNWNNRVGEVGVSVTLDAGPPAIVTNMDENTCSDGYDNDGDTLTDENDPDCVSGREIPSYSVEAYKFGKGKFEFDFNLTGPIDDIINLENLPPSVTLTQPEFTSFARIVSLTGTAWDGQSPPYASDIIAMQNQFGYVTDVQIQPPNSDQWYSAIDTSQSGGIITKESYPFSSWSFDWDLSNYPEGEGDVTFKVRSYDGLEYSPLTVRKYKLNLEAPTLVINTPANGQTHTPNSQKGSFVSFTGTATDQYFGIQGSDIQTIWFEITDEQSGLKSKFPVTADLGESLTAWSYYWDYSIYSTGKYTFTIWASDSDFCGNDYSDSTCDQKSVEVNIVNENARPGIVLESMYEGEVIRGSESTPISGYVYDNDGLITRVEIDIYSGGRSTGNSPYSIVIRQDQIEGGDFNSSWDTANIWKTNSLPHNSNYEIVVKSFDGQLFSVEESVFITIDNSVNNLPPTFDPSGWASVVKVYCDENSKSLNRCGLGAVFDLKDYFQDPESGILIFEVYDDPKTELDNFYESYFSISAEGIATYNPSASRSDQIKDWSLVDLKFMATDLSELSTLSRQVDIDIEAIQFTVLRDDIGSVITTSDPASFSGIGLPKSLVEARFDSSSGQVINSTRVLSDGTWQMYVTTGQLGSADSRTIIFEMDGQLFQGENTNQDSQFKLLLSEEEESSNLFIIIIVIILGVVLLIGVGAFFFTFEEDLEDESELSLLNEVQQNVDPYAWAKEKNVPEIPSTPEVQQVVQTQQVVQQETTSQHPGWLWDAESNQWIPDPNYISNP